MKSYLVNEGVPAEFIIEDSNGYDSYMTAQNARKLMEENDLNSAMVIKQYFHVSRSKLSFRKLGINEVYAAHANIFEPRDIYSVVREFPAYYKYCLNDYSSIKQRQSKEIVLAVAVLIVNSPCSSNCILFTNKLIIQQFETPVVALHQEAQCVSHLPLDNI